MQKSLEHTLRGALPVLLQPDGMKVRSGLLRSGSPQATAAAPSLLGYRGVLRASRPVDMQIGHLQALQEMPEKHCLNRLLSAEHLGSLR